MDCRIQGHSSRIAQQKCGLEENRINWQKKAHFHFHDGHGETLALMNIGTMEDGRNRLKKKSLPSVKWSPPSILARSALHIQPLHVLITLFRSVRVHPNQVAFHRVGLKRLQKNFLYRNVELCKRVYNYHGASFQLDKLHGSLLLLGNCGGENGSKK